MNKLIWFCLGAGVGSLATWFVTKKYYQQRADEEVEDVIEAFKKQAKEIFAKESEQTSEIKIITEEPGIYLNNELTAFTTNKPDLKDYADKVGAYKTAYEEAKKKNALYAIAPDEYGEFEDYSQISIRYYTDGVMVDASNGEIISEDDLGDLTVDDFVGLFGEYEEDLVCMRDDMRCCDYEILNQYRTYSDYLASKQEE